MRNARPQALSTDGSRLIVETDDGEQIAILADARLRQLLRGERPRPQLEIEMDTELTPREIQARIRAGASVAELVSASGMPSARIEAFAAPVIAERDHIAGMAQLGSVRRRGEQAGHRTLRAAIADRLRERDVDAESVVWDAYKLDDGRWSVSADYRLQDTDRQAVFYFDHRGRFSVSANEDARWMIGEQPNDPLADPITETEEGDAEPTVRLSGDADELALLRAVETGITETGLDDDAPQSGPSPLRAVPNTAAGEPSSTTAADDAAQDMNDPEPVADEQSETAETEDSTEAADNTEAQGTTDTQGTPGGAPGAESQPSQLDLLYDILGNSSNTEDSVRVYDGLSDAAAVPEVGDGSWQAPPTDDVPAEPEEIETEPEDPEAATTEADRPTTLAAEPVEAEPAAAPEAEPNETLAPDTESSATEDESAADKSSRPTHDTPSPETPSRDTASQDSGSSEATNQEAASQDTLPGAETQAPAKPKPKRKRRASVPSWDEIMFGSPKGK